MKHSTINTQTSSNMWLWGKGEINCCGLNLCQFLYTCAIYALRSEESADIIISSESHSQVFVYLQTKLQHVWSVVWVLASLLPRYSYRWEHRHISCKYLDRANSAKQPPCSITKLYRIYTVISISYQSVTGIISITS